MVYGISLNPEFVVPPPLQAYISLIDADDQELAAICEIADNQGRHPIHHSRYGAAGLCSHDTPIGCSCCMFVVTGGGTCLFAFALVTLYLAEITEH